ncbi:YitT family protein [Sulfurospirillum arcachonense]|uniref:YitT family protein n=1 Tax=Sulfurospirillum arcachonense TaxID=57666 RepID=UPI000468AAB7|nr:YitT family protein [Sulfurospirillum arcachonense]
MHKEELKNYMYNFAGSIILGLSIVLFFSPNKLVTGGTAGLSLLIHYITPYTIGTLIMAINIPLLLVGVKYLGKMFAIRTIVTLLLISISTDFFIEVLHLKAFVMDTILGSLFGGILVGVGIALVIKGNSSAGGSTIIARIVSSKTEIKPSQVILVIDTLIVLSALFILDDNVRVLWSVVSIYVTTRVIDMILTGSLNKKVVYLVTNKTDELKIKIREELGKYGTILNGDGLYDEKKKMILIVVEVSKLQFLRSLVKEYDPDGFLIITEANEMLGRGH